MKKLISTCIVSAILRITCQYTETVGVYQTEVTKAEMISAHNDIKDIVYSGDGLIEDWHEYEYDEMGNMIKRVCLENNTGYFIILGKVINLIPWRVKSVTEYEYEYAYAD